MELRDFCLIFFRKRKLFVGVLSGTVAVSALILGFQPDRFETELILNVTRSGSHETPDYSYDQFYRLQADERFADTVTRWLATDSFREEIRRAAEATEGVADSIAAKRLSSQVIVVTYVSPTRDGFGRMAEALSDAVNREAERLNEDAGAADWFAVLADSPTVRDARLGAGLLLSLGAAFGAFLAFWAVLILHYFLGVEETGRDETISSGR